MNILAEKLNKIIVVESSDFLKQAIGEILEQLGFSGVQIVGSIQRAISVAEAEDVDWIISGLCSDQPVNCIQLLKMCSLYPSLKNLKVSLFVEEKEEDCLLLAFDLGLFSYHPKSSSNKTLKSTLESLINTFAHNNDFTLTAASFLRTFLLKRKEFSLLLSLEKGLLDLYPGSAKILMNLAAPITPSTIKQPRDPYYCRRNSWMNP